MLCRCRTSAAGKREKTHNEQSLTAASQKVREILWRLAMRKGEAISFEGKLRDNCGGRQIPVARRLATTTRSGMGLVSRVTPVHTAMRNCTRDEGRSFEFGNQVLISSHRKLLSSKAMVVNVAEKSGHDPVRHGSGRRAQANELRVSASRSRCRNSVGLNAVGSIRAAGRYGIFN
jgi:hypothetical protein